MIEQQIEDSIGGVLTGETQKNALEYAACLRVSEMTLERWRCGYWEDKLYWVIKYKKEVVCFVLINGSEKPIRGLYGLMTVIPAGTRTIR